MGLIQKVLIMIVVVIGNQVCYQTVRLQLMDMENGCKSMLVKQFCYKLRIENRVCKDMRFYYVPMGVIGLKFVNGLEAVYKFRTLYHSLLEDILDLLLMNKSLQPNEDKIRLLIRTKKYLLQHNY